MGMFFPMEDEKRPGGRQRGFARYRQLLERDWKQMFLMDLVTLATFIPYGLGVAYAIMSESVLVLVPASVLGGMIAGQGIAAMYDFLLRRARDEEIWFWFSFKKSLRQNWRASLLPGAVEGLYLGFLLFSGLLMWISKRITAVNIGIFTLASVIFTMVYSVWWPQVVLFSQRTGTMLKNCVLFILQNPGRVFLSSLVQVGWWAVTFLLMPWTAFLVPVLGVWYILFVTLLMIYPKLDAAFRIEEQIRELFPGRTPEDE